MKKRFIYSGLFILLYVFFLIINIPAIWVLEHVKSPEGVEIKSTQGTIWQAHFEAIKLPEGVLLHNVEVKLNPLSFLWLNPSADITFGGDKLPGPRGSLSLSDLFSSVSVNNLNVEMKARDAIALMDLPLDLTGHNDIKFTASEYVLGKPMCSAVKGKLTWPKAKVTSFNETVDLGALSGDFTCDKGQLIFTMDPKNILGLTYEVVIANKERVSGIGYLEPAADFPEKLKLILPMLGKPDAQGRYRLHF